MVLAIRGRCETQLRRGEERDTARSLEGSRLDGVSAPHLSVCLRVEDVVERGRAGVLQSERDDDERDGSARVERGRDDVVVARQGLEVPAADDVLIERKEGWVS